MSRHSNLHVICHFIRNHCHVAIKQPSTFLAIVKLLGYSLYPFIVWYIVYIHGALLYFNEPCLCSDWVKRTVPNDKKKPLKWRHNGHDNVSNHQLHDCLLNCLFWRRSKKTSKLRVTGLCVGNSPVIGVCENLSNDVCGTLWKRSFILSLLCSDSGLPL